jgi:hypothetical protein
MRLVVRTVAILFCLCSPARAHADTSQDAYVNELHSHSIGLENPDARLLKDGYLMCTLLTAQDVVTTANLSAPQTSLSVPQTAFQIGAAIRWLCPEQVWQIKELGQADPSVPGVTSAIAGYAGAGS